MLLVSKDVSSNGNTITSATQSNDKALDGGIFVLTMCAEAAYF
jgi:hypothetical protein